MNERVKEFLDAKKCEEKKKYEQRKNKTLLELGLFEKVYSEKEEYSNDFPFSEYDSENSKNRWYRKEVISISDEEFEEIKKYSKKEETTENNPIATALTFIAWILFIVGFIAGIALGTIEVEKGYYYTYTDTEFSFAIAFTYWCAAFISGTMFLGFAEIIKLLDAIKRK